ncbi:MAG: indolepyruvate ferredoxin oxidoreductase subunit beta [Candidatus Thermoplasmatota archaeon]|nr:indolepyruvate ferredoxin oxidoreductase subunit beta [Candidatus Thermoplasmatota archaeon]
MAKKINIVLTGVGGQGVITAANILGKAAVAAKVPVFVSEVHGMAQRGGSVNCTVRLGDVSGPLIASGTADVILSMEPIETLRNIAYAHKKTTLITDITPVIPFTVTVGGESYPDLEKVFTELAQKTKIIKIDALSIAKQAGAVITRNIVMLGALAASQILPISNKILLETILQNVPKKYQDINKRAFQGGIDAYKNSTPQ